MLTVSADAIVTPLPLNITPLGVAIAIVFLCSIVGILVWMLRLPKETKRTMAVTRVVRSVRKQVRILVPLLGTEDVNDRMVALATQVAHYRNGEVELLAVIEVPFTLPLDAQVERDEREAQGKLEQAAVVFAQMLGGNRNGARVRKRLLKARSAGAALVREAEDYAVDLILIANRPGTVRGASQQIDPAVEYVMKNAPCEVLVFSQARAAVTYEYVAEEESVSEKAVPAGTTS
ncbi:MAG TPA: universal stress protein [Ktedonobacteraceae bacterium]|jgi:nucleotide-binding universal stress UspA family protein